MLRPPHRAKPRRSPGIPQTVDIPTISIHLKSQKRAIDVGRAGELKEHQDTPVMVRAHFHDTAGQRHDIMM